MRFGKFEIGFVELCMVAFVIMYAIDKFSPVCK